MSEYDISIIHSNDVRNMKKVEALLRKEGIEKDPHLDYTIGMFDDSYRLIATGSCFHRTLRCLAVDSEYQGLGLMNEIVSQLVEAQLARGNRSLFMYTKSEASAYFQNFNFYEIARVENRLSFLENIKGQFEAYINNLLTETCSQLSISAPLPKSAAVVLNANPFTLGHQYLVETAAAENEILHLFIVSEDASLVPFDIRYNLVREGTKHLKNIVYHLSGDYMISNETFPSYFIKTECAVIESHADLDIDIFTRIAKKLNITKRYVSEEPFSKVTAIYNRSMEQNLPKYGIELVEIPRRTDGGIPISASEVRLLLKTERMKELKSKLPACVYEFFLSDEGKTVIRHIQEATGSVIHY